MKKIHLLSFAFLFILSAFAQQVPNGNFEAWSYNPSSFSYEPTGWKTANFGQYGDSAVRRYKPAHGGNYACGFQTSFVLNTFALPGVLSTTFPISVQPKNLVGYIKGNLALDDTAILIIEFSKDTNVIGDGLYYLTQSQNNYIKFVVPISFYGMGNPDSCTITVFSGGTSIDDTLTSFAIDDLSFEYPVNVNSIFNNAKKLNLYPNPANSFISIASSEDYHSVLVYNDMGQQVATFGNIETISIEDWNKGLYFLQIKDQNNQVIETASFLKQ
ncbi:MAG: T9SS type A sorting domain-containing protein [bacterium]|nr:T9SS type A sorting domain-containing protein [bacterium]